MTTEAPLVAATRSLDMLTITAPNLDPIRVIAENYGPGQGRIIIQCWNASWCSYWGAMGLETVEEFFVGCDVGYLADNLMAANGLAKKKNDAIYLGRVIDAVQQALRAHIKKPSKLQLARRQRTKDANDLINVISSHGRRFFRRAEYVSRLEIDEKGRIWFVDSYRGARILPTPDGPWRGFGQGGTLRDLVKLMINYIRTGEKISEGYIVIKSHRREDFVDNIWGYEPEAAAACRAAALKLPIIKAHE